MNILTFLQTVDRRFLYAMLLFVVAAPFFFTVKLPVNISSQTQKFYDAVEELPAESFVLFSADFGAGTAGESKPQAEAVMRHLMKKKLRIAIIAFEPQGKALGQKMAEDLGKEFGRVEGTHWCNFGYKTDSENYLKGFVQDIQTTVSTDIHGKPLRELPVMQGVQSGKDIKFLIDIAPSGIYETYIKFVQGPYKIPMGLAATAVMAPEAFNRIDSGQLVGLLGGLQGAMEYEKLNGKPGKATRAGVSSSMAHLLIIAFIILGNVAMILERRQRARTEI